MGSEMCIRDRAFAGRGGLAGADARSASSPRVPGALGKPAEQHEWALNALLPRTVRLRQLELAPTSACGALRWSCMHNALAKLYVYRWAICPQHDPLDCTQRAHVRTSERSRFDLEAVRRAASHLEGTHDWRSFTNLPFSGASEAARAGRAQHAARDHTRTVRALRVVEEGVWSGGLMGGSVRLEFELDGALYKMVRNIVGTLAAVGLGRIGPDEIPKILAAHDRSRLPAPAPAHGLTLERVWWSEEPTEAPLALAEAEADGSRDE